VKAEELLEKTDDPGYRPGGRSLRQLRLATSLEQAGRFREARESLRELWPSSATPPLLDGLDPATAAQLLHRAGSLADALRGEEPSGSDAAEELLSRSIAIYEESGDRASASSVRITLACCLWHRGDADRARDLLHDALEVGTNPSMKFTPPRDWTCFSLTREVCRYERLIIKRALKDAGGMVSQAARMLGFRHHNSLIVRINKRHTDLLASRSPIFPRKQSVMRAGVSAAPPADPVRPTILHVAGDRAVAEAVKKQLEADGWRVETYRDAKSALKKLAGDAQFDMLLFDGDLSGMSGPELVRAAKAIPRRRSTPVAILSARDCEAAAWRAGVDAFLRKPEGLLQVSQMMARLRGGQVE
jgi:CheY-like chemotaxis protein